MEAPSCPHCGRKALRSLYGGAEPMLRCHKCGCEYSVLLVPPKWYLWIQKRLEELRKDKSAAGITETDSAQNKRSTT